MKTTNNSLKIDFLKNKKKESIAFNKEDDYINVDANLDFANGCVIVADIVVDVAADVAVDVVADVAADAVADTLADAAADAVADVAADTAADAAGDVAADTVLDATVNEGVSTISNTVMKTIVGILTTAVVTPLVTLAVSAIQNAIKGSKGGTPASTTSEDFWNSLYDTMVKAIPCDTSAATSCPGTNQRLGQEAMILAFQQNIATGSPDSATAAIAFEKIFTQQQQSELKSALTNISNTNGIPSMVKYMASYTNPGAQGAPLVIATANTLIAVTNYVFSD